jgi:hypothetical protein
MKHRYLVIVTFFSFFSFLEAHKVKQVGAYRRSSKGWPYQSDWWQLALYDGLRTIRQQNNNKKG